MKNKELRSKLERLQSRAYNLQLAIQDLVRDLEIEMNEEKNKNEM